MNDTEYIGMRYVPVFADPSQWNISRQYENLMMVTNEGETYISKQFVPTGIELTNENYWVKISVPGGSTSGGVDYSTEEQDTGRKWIDGKPIYCKTLIDINNNVDVSLSSLNIDKLIKYEGSWVNTISSTPYVRDLDSYSSDYGWSNITYDAKHHTLQLNMRASGNYDGSIITIYYTKTTDTV